MSSPREGRGGGRGRGGSGGSGGGGRGGGGRGRGGSGGPSGGDKSKAPTTPTRSTLTTTAEEWPSPEQSAGRRSVESTTKSSVWSRATSADVGQATQMMSTLTTESTATMASTSTSAATATTRPLSIGVARAPQPQLIQQQLKSGQGQTGATAASASASAAAPSKALGRTYQEEVEKLGGSKIFNEQHAYRPNKREAPLGRPIPLWANHFKLKVKPFKIYQYDVSLERTNADPNRERERDEDLRNKPLVKQMFKTFVDTYLKDPKYRSRIVYNFSKNMYSMEKLPFQDSQSFDLRVENQPYRLTLQKINEVDVDFAKLSDPELIQIMDIIMTHRFSILFHNLNRSFFNPANKEIFELGFGIQLWKGAYASVRPSECGLTWNLDTANAVFYEAGDLLELAMKFYNCRDANALKNAIVGDRDGTLIGASFIEQFRGREIKTRTGGFRKKIHSFGYAANNYKFDWAKPDGQTVKISIQDYMKQHYNITLRHPDMPCINLGKETYVPIELCSTEPRQKKRLSEQETRDMIKHTAVRAPDRMQHIQNWAAKSEIKNDPILKEFNIELDLRMIQLEGRVLTAPDVQYGNRAATSSEIGEKGAWDHRNLSFVSPREIDRWVVVNMAGRRVMESINEFINSFKQVGRRHGVNVRDPLNVEELNTFNKRGEQVNAALRDIFRKYNDVRLLVGIVANQDETYKFLKTHGDRIFGVPTQIVLSKNATRVSEQLVSNLLLKINTKLGGRNFILAQNTNLFAKYLQELFKGPLMIFGADVTHPAPGEGDVQSESIAAVTGSLDRDCSYYIARLMAQRAPKADKGAQEIIFDLDRAFVDLLNEYFKINKTYPKSIVFFRDGVSEGQFDIVLAFEINKIRSACERIGQGSYKPAITFVVVQKRHHTRFFPIRREDQNGRAMNVPPGTVVDKEIVHPRLWDFFLCSHAGIQGTSRPCRYFILHDDHEFSMNQVELLSHYLCHIYARCPRSVSYPAPVYYAHLAAFRGRQYVRNEAQVQSPNYIQTYEIELHPNIRNKMFFT